MEEFFSTDKLCDDSIARAIKSRRIFPCFFGSALKLKGVNELISAISRYTRATSYPESLFGAKVYKIMRDSAGKRVTLAKITGGSLAPKDTVEFRKRDGELVREKVEEVRLLTHDKSRPLKSVRS